MLHAGLCDAPGAVVADLGAVGSAMTLNGTAVPVETVGAPPSGTLELAVVDLPIPLTTIVGGEHSIVVHRSAEDLSILACGNVGGQLAGGTKLPVPLAAGVDGQHGIAVLADSGDGTTRVSILLGEWDDEMHGSLSADAATAEVVLGDFHEIGRAHV